MNERNDDSPVKRALIAIDKLRARLDQVEKEKREPIAIIGAGCRFPGGVTDLLSYSARLQEGFDAVVEVPRDRWDADAWYDADPSAAGKTNSRVGGFLDQVEAFDAAFFGLSPREAASIDPQHRLLLEVVWEALEDAGQAPASLRGSATGVFVGLYAEDYAQLLSSSTSGGDAYAVTGSARSFAAGRISYLLDLRGPSEVIDTVCSSSLVAVDAACQSLRSRRCSLAIAGAASLMISPSTSVLTSKLFALSPSGRCRTFDAAADGYVRGEGCGVVVLKRLSDALASRDRILAVIRGSAVNHDGFGTSLTAPNVESQRDVIARALEDAGVAPADVSYVEAHGTGTALGDPIEFDALKAALDAKDAPACAVGSVKTNIGHLEAAAGMAGLLKVVAALSAERIPPHLHLSRLNPNVEIEGTRFVVPTEGRPWPKGGRRRIAGVSSFGLSGTNAHVVIEEPPDPDPRASSGRPIAVLPLSARSPEALRARALGFASAIEHGSSERWLGDAAYSSAARREHHQHRLCVVGSADEIVRALRAHASGSEAPGLAVGAGDGRRRTVFVYSGQGSQWIGMGLGLLGEPAFAARLAECDRAIGALAGFSVLDVLRAGPSDPRWQRVDVIQPLLFATQVALSAQWSALGVEPDAVIGYSMGEVAASVVAGRLALEDAAKIIVSRGRIVARASGRGRMALVQLSSEATERELARWPGVSIASHHSPEAVLVSGDAQAVEGLVRTLEGRGVFARLVDVDYASHCSHVDPLLAPLEAELSGISGLRSGRILQCSTVTAAPIDGLELSAGYWARNLREPVRFRQAVERLVSLGYDLFVEISPHPVLVAALEQTVGERVTGSLRRDREPIRELSEALGRLYVFGARIDWTCHAGDARPVSLPAYPWQRSRHWMAPPRPAARSTGGSGWLGSSVRVGPSPARTIREGLLGDSSTAWLAEHVVAGDPIVPAAVWLDAALEIAREAWGPGAHTICAVELVEPLKLGHEPALVQTICSDASRSEASFEICSPGSGWKVHARGRIRRDDGRKPASPAPLAGSAAVLTSARFYEGMRSRGLAYGPHFQVVRSVKLDGARALVDLALPPEASQGLGHVVHPALLDGCLQALAATVSDRAAAVPIAIDALRLLRPIGSGGRVLAELSSDDGREIVGDLTLLAEDGSPLLVVEGLRARRFGSRLAEEHLYALRWEPRPAPSAKATISGRWLVLSDEPGTLVEGLRAAGAWVVRVERGAVYSQSGDGFVVDPRDPEHHRRLLADLDGPLSGVIHMYSAEDEPYTDPSGATQAGCVSVMHLVQALAHTQAPRLWIVTRRAQAAGGSVDPTHAALWGLVRTLAHEHPELRPSAVDLGGRAPEEIAALLTELAVDGPETQVAFRGADRLVARVGSAGLRQLERPEQTAPAGARPYLLSAPRPGLLDEIELRASVRRTPGEGEVEIEVAAAGLNFLDVLHAMGVYPGQQPGAATLGYECSGRVLAIGGGVEGLSPGDEVVAIAQASLGSHVIADARMVLPRPPSLPAPLAAATPLAYLTAWYALARVARLARGERVLIHSATGGVGLAAIAIAKRLGAHIVATAGTEEKRAHLRTLEVEHVLSSRAPFLGGVLAATDGRGVDVVLNSLAGDAVEQGLAALAPYGRFVEIGKKDVYEDRPLGLSEFRRGLTYTLLDVAALVRDRAPLVRSAWAEVTALLADGSLSALPIESVPVARAGEALRRMAAAQHIGKIVVIPGGPETQVLPEPTEVRADASYLVTGGFGGLGIAVAGWLLDRGAGKVVLAGRHPNTATLLSLGERASRVEAVACDVSDEAAVSRLVSRLAADRGQPLRGVIHAAGVLDDGLLVKQDERRFAGVMAAKVRGAAALDASTIDVPLDFFVLFSSAAALLGSPGQSSYAAANAFLDALAHDRHARGLPATTIQWGAWAEIGLAAARTDRGERLAKRGMGLLAPAEALAALGALISARAVEAAVLSLDGPAWQAAYPSAARAPALEGLGARAPEEEGHADPVSFLREAVARTFRVPAASLDDERSLLDLGCDSLTALELKNRLAVGLKVAIPALSILRAPSLGALAREVLAAAAPERAMEPAPAPQIVPDPGRRHEPFPLTDIQQAYWIGRSASLELGSTGCHVYVELEQDGLDLERLDAAWARVIERHDMLRAVVLPDGRQQILPEVSPYHIEVLDLRGRSDVEKILGEVREEMSHQVFAPHVWPLFDVRVSRLARERVRVHFSLDLLTADPATVFRILRDWGEHYRSPDLRPIVPELSFRDYVLGAVAFRESDAYRRARAYWDAKIPQIPPPPELPLTCDPTTLSQPRFCTRERRLSPERWARLKRRAEEAGITPSAVLLATFAELIERWSTSPDFSLVLTLFTRLPLHPDVHEIVGDFTSTVILAVNSEQGSFIDRARRLHQRLLEDLDHAQVSGVEVLREMSRSRRQRTLMGVVFTSMVGHDDLSSFEWLGRQVLKVTQTPQVYFDHQVLEDRGALVWYWDTVEDLFPEGMLDAMLESYAAALDRLQGDESAWSAPNLIELPASQSERIRRASSGESALVPISNALLHSGFEAMARSQPDAPAVISSRRRLSYADLASESRRVARWLRRQGVQPNQLVALVMEKGWEQVVGALGVLLAGAAYLPVEASLPAERIGYLLAHGEVRVVLVQPTLAGSIAWPEGLTVRAISEEPWDEDDSPLAPMAGPDDLAYVLYTSGSTGKPKGVAMPHRGPVATNADVSCRIKACPSDRVLALSSLSFDLSVYDVFGVLEAGGAIVLPDPESSRDPAAWLRWIRGEGVTLWNSVPALLAMLVEHTGATSDCAGLAVRTILLSGDWIPVELPDRARALFVGAQVHSLGGPTEAAIWQATYPIGRVDPKWRSIPYGTPLSHHKIYVLDKRGRMCPEHVAGELYIGGRGLAHGYWRDEVRTRESFVVHPETGERLYKSGDLGRWLPAGYIEFLGRNDHQVKIQGHRIELGEIEAALETHPDVIDAVVIAKGEATKSRSLIAYVVERAGAVSDEAERLAFKLAEHNRRRDLGASARVALSRSRPIEQDRALYAERASHRSFSPEPLDVGRLGDLLAALSSISIEGEPLGKLRYPSAGHLYPVQTYLYVAPDRVAGLRGGVYYYDFKEHVLAEITADVHVDPSVHVPPNRRMAAEAAFSLFFVARLPAIEPLYGSLAREFSLIEVGAMAQLLMTCAHPLGIGLCEVGAVDVSRIAPLLRLDEGHAFLHTMVGGPLGERPRPVEPPPARDLAGLLARHLAERLPSYMVPAAFVRIERIPLTANGKLDRAALPEPGDPAREEVAPPRSDLERALVDLARSVIGSEQIGIRTQLFELGFTSIQVVTLSRRLKEDLGLDVSVVELFRLPTVEALAAFVGRAPAALAGADERAEKRRTLLERRRTSGEES